MTVLLSKGQLLVGVAPVQVARASAILAAGWDAAPTEMVTAEATRASIFLEYTRGGAAGAVDLRVEISPYSSNPLAGEAWFRPPVQNLVAFVAGADEQVLAQREFITYTATGAVIEAILVAQVELEGAAERMRIACRESGALLTPGTARILVHLR